MSVFSVASLLDTFRGIFVQLSHFPWRVTLLMRVFNFISYKFSDCWHFEWKDVNESTSLKGYTFFWSSVLIMKNRRLTIATHTKSRFTDDNQSPRPPITTAPLLISPQTAPAYKWKTNKSRKCKYLQALLEEHVKMCSKTIWCYSINKISLLCTF